ncbi:MAG: DUF438 domain-containing protein [Eubacteriales bacterium]|nr:DUF438 domain-containing protein [Eubacteriales bacterium]
MSELINNREILSDRERREGLKSVIHMLHDGVPVAEAKAAFARISEGISGDEIARLEGELVAEGMPVEEIQRLCDVHADVFRDQLVEPDDREMDEIPGHPVRTLIRENEALASLIKSTLEPQTQAYAADPAAGGDALAASLGLLYDIDKHYGRKEMLIFPYLEKYGREAPPKVMWGVDDEIRSAIKSCRRQVMERDPNVVSALTDLYKKISEMFFKEENILVPMLAELLTEDEWLAIARESAEIGYCLVEPDGPWIPKRHELEADAHMQHLMGQASDKSGAPAASAASNAPADGLIRFDTGVLRLDQLSALLDKLPLDITFVDENDIVRYFSRADERVFPRPKTVIGRHVNNCHPPQSVHVVEQLVSDFKAGTKDSEDFWIEMKGMFVLIRYFAVRGEDGRYLGTLEVTQNIAPLKAIEGEKRLLS